MARTIKSATAKSDTEIGITTGEKTKTVKSPGKLSTAEARREYQRQYYQKHKDKAKEYQRQYNLTHKKKSLRHFGVK